jgi:hypothetical protein
MEVARVKYNNYRRANFQTATVILEGEGRRHVVKRGLSVECVPHIASMRPKFDALNDTYRRFHVIPPTIVNGEAHFEFDKNVSLLAKLCNLVRQGDMEGFELELMKFAGAVGDAAKNTNGWWKHEGFVKVFGQIDPQFQKAMLCVDPANVDLVFSNVHVRNSEDVPYTMFDYEWTFDFPVPLEYVIWRALMRFTSTLRANTYQKWTTERLCRIVGVDFAREPMFRAMEASFQAHVYGSEEVHNAPESVDWEVPILNFEDLAKMVANAPHTPVRGRPKPRFLLVKRLLGPALPLARRIKRRLRGR